MATAAQAVVLVVEDDLPSREALARLLISAGFSVAAVGDGAEAFRRLRLDPRPCAIVLDLLLPVLDGWTFCEQLRSDSDLSCIPVIVCSGTPPEVQQSGGLAFRVQDFVPKPVDAEVLLTALRRVGC